MSNVAIIDYLQDVAQMARRCPTATLVRAYARAARELCTESRWYQVNVQGATVADQQQYSLGNDPLLEIIGILAMQGTDNSGGSPQKFPIRVSDATTWTPDDGTGRPTRYAYIPEAQFALHRTPDKVYDLLVTLQCTPKEDVTQLPAELMPKWSKAFQDGALAYLLMLPDQPWTDPLLATGYEAKFRAAKSNAKADAQRRFQTGTVMASGRRLW